jgi:histone H1/5
MTDLTTGSSSLNTSQGASGNTAGSKGKKTKSTAGGSSANKNKKAKGTSSHPKFSAMIKQALTQLNARNGTSKAAILKYILANFKVNATTANQHLKSALRAGTKNNSLKQTKGIGASGSFKLATPAKKAAASGGQKKKTVKKST